MNFQTTRLHWNSPECEHNDITATHYNSLSACATNLQIELSSLSHTMDSQKGVSVMVKQSHLQLAPGLQYHYQMETGILGGLFKHETPSHRTISGY